MKKLVFSALLLLIVVAVYSSPQKLDSEADFLN